ncbi:MAG: glycosyltransferase family 4 protein [Acidobacteriota bacterium]
MRILYAALDQRVPGTTGGSVHVSAVAEGLAALGHDVTVLARPGPEGFPPRGKVRWHAMRPPLGVPRLRALRGGAVRSVAASIGAEAILERYYNFGGEGILAARATGALAILEVNAPVIDYPGSPKALLDRALLVEPMRRWREWQCRAADLIVTPAAGILPASVPHERIVEIEWGADTDRFHPGARGAVPFERRPGSVVVVFAGAFRAWHGAAHLVRAMRVLRGRGRSDIHAVLVGTGPELGRTRAEAAGVDGITFTGAVDHGQMPACLAACDIGVAPFDLAAHAPLRLDFYWSPLKVFEYMAAGLPVVVPSIDRLRRIVRSGHEGLLYDAGAADALADVLTTLADSPDLRARLGRGARDRVVRQFSWAAHCARLDGAMRQAREWRHAAHRRCES